MKIYTLSVDSATGLTTILKYGRPFLIAAREMILSEMEESVRLLNKEAR